MDDDECPDCGATGGAHTLECREDPANWDDPLDDDQDDDGDGW